MDIREAFKPFLNKDGTIDAEKFKAAFQEYSAKNTIQPVQDNSQESIDRFEQVSRIERDNQRAAGDIIVDNTGRISNIGADRYAKDTGTYLGAQMPILNIATGEADKTRGSQMEMLDKFLADRKEAREFNARMTPGKVVDMISRLGATAGLLFR